MDFSAFDHPKLSTVEPAVSLGHIDVTTLKLEQNAGSKLLENLKTQEIALCAQNTKSIISSNNHSSNSSTSSKTLTQSVANATRLSIDFAGDSNNSTKSRKNFTKSQLKSTRSSKHSKGFTCRFKCKKYFSDFMECIKHEQQHTVEIEQHKIKSAPNATKRTAKVILKCDVCAFWTADSCQMVAHKRFHKFECDICKTMFVNKFCLGSHMKEMHLGGEIPFACSHCDKLFAEETALKRHESVHTRKPFGFACNVCGRFFSSFGLLISHHTRTHSDRKLFSCSDCCKTFNSKANFDFHELQLHARKKDSVRNTSNVAFSSSADLNLHMGYNSVERMYGCSVCHMTFSKITSLRSHKTIHSNKNPSLCSNCGKKFCKTCVLAHQEKIRPKTPDEHESEYKPKRRTEYKNKPEYQPEQNSGSATSDRGNFIKFPKIMSVSAHNDSYGESRRKSFPVSAELLLSEEISRNSCMDSSDILSAEVSEVFFAETKPFA